MLYQFWQGRHHIVTVAAHDADEAKKAAWRFFYESNGNEKLDWHDLQKIWNKFVRIISVRHSMESESLEQRKGHKLLRYGSFLTWMERRYCNECPLSLSRSQRVELQARGVDI